MVDIYVKEANHSPLNGEASAEIESGYMVTAAVGGGLSPADTAAGDELDGIVPVRNRGPNIREHEEDYSPKVYKAGEYPVPFHPLEDNMELELPAGQAVDLFQEVAVLWDGSEHVVVPSGTTDASAPVGTALYAASSGEKVRLRVEK